MKKISILLFGIISIVYFSSCSELEYPEVGSIADKTPPKAAFGYVVSDTSYQEIAFTNFSISATDYSWDLGNGETSTEMNPSSRYEDGRYLVTLTASDKLGVVNTISDSLIIIKPVGKLQPIIQNPGFDIEGDNSYKDFWTNRDLSDSYNEMQITSSPVESGEKAAKLPSAGDRIGYQDFTVEENTDYIVNFYYTMKTTPAGSLTVDILDSHVTNPVALADRTIATGVFTDQTDANIYTKGQVEFNSGSSTRVAIYFHNEGVECRTDTWSIDVK
jgi:hypothetical protein